MPGPLGFSALPVELKPVSAFVQRADELKTSEPVVAYWCTYYAAQQGIALGAKGAAARTFLGELLGTLENMKENISKNDTDAKEIVDSDAASAAYVEGFALKVFNAADNEDRAGKATRGTAKKFLAAANFMEVLKVFDQQELVESHADKVRYAKWKAADIARAFREGRLPVPGPADAPPDLPVLDLPPPSGLPGPGDLGSTAQAPHIDPADIARANTLVPSADPSRHDAPHTPSAWSTLATPGEPTPSATHTPSDALFGTTSDRHASVERVDRNDPTFGVHLQPGEEEAPPGRAESTASIFHGDTTATDLPRANANADVLNIDPQEKLSAELANGLLPGEMSAPPVGAESGASVLAGDTSLTRVPYANANTAALGLAASPKLAPAYDDSPPPLAPSAPPLPSAPAEYTPVIPHSNLPPPGFVPSSYAPPNAGAAGLGIPPPPVIYAQQPQPRAFVPPPAAYAQQPSAPPRPPSPPELTPQIIARIQKHCRYAVSALDYEDPETARKELRAALAMLGG